ncbi:MAG: hypothetical protein RBT36_10080 [Desulfobulbus sp.]|jgi:putative transposase|nr:hypothetical protein [Desulfobulbus sp.]
MARGFVSLVAVIDWASRNVMVAKIAITLEACYEVDVLHQALNRHGTPEIINTDQGSQCTSAEWCCHIGRDKTCRRIQDSLPRYCWHLGQYEQFGLA